MGSRCCKQSFWWDFTGKRVMKTTFNPILLKNGPCLPIKNCMTAVCSVSNYMMHPRNISCSVSKFPGSTPLLPCSCVEGNSSRGTYMFTKPPTVFNIHKSTLHLYLINKKRTKKKTKPISTYRSMHSERKKSTWRLFKNFKSQCSVTKHIIPLIILTYYTYEWYCLKTLEPQLLEVQSQQGQLWDTWNYKYTLDNSHDSHRKTRDYVKM